MKLEKTLGGSLMSFVTKCQSEQLGTAIFFKPVEVDLAHCLRTQSIDGNPLAMIAWLHHFQTKQKKI